MSAAGRHTAAGPLRQRVLPAPAIQDGRQDGATRTRAPVGAPGKRAASSCGARVAALAVLDDPETAPLAAPQALLRAATGSGDAAASCPMRAAHGVDCAAGEPLPRESSRYAAHSPGPVSTVNFPSTPQSRYVSGASDAGGSSLHGASSSLSRSVPARSTNVLNGSPSSRSAR